MLPSQFSHYSIITKIGEGGMGEVYLAEDTTLDRRVVIKVLSAKVAQDERARKRLIREAKSASSLEHANICTVYEVGEFDGRDFIAMQYVEGDTLDAAVKGPLTDARKALDIAVQLAAALAAAHAKGIIHRDIKPQNIVLNAQGQVKVLDFGLSKRVPVDPAADGNAKTQSLLSDQKTLTGTAPYMSPEQICAEELDARSDVFSFGTVMYELLSGQHPFIRKTTGETLSAILTFKPPPLRLRAPGVPEKFAQIIARCLAKEKSQRFRDGQELLDALDRLKQDFGGARTFEMTRRKYAAGLFLTFALLLAGAGLYLLYGRNEAAAEPPRIESIAILPLENVGRDEALEYLSDGLADSLINSLSQLSEVKVIARNSVFRYRGRHVDPVTVGRELKVQTLLLGKIAQQAEEITVNMALVDARDNRHIWGAKYTFKPDEALRVQETIAREVYERLRPRPRPQPGGAGPKNYTANREAYQMYLKGRYFWNKRTESGLKKGVEYFNQAIDLDPSYALAYAGLADSYALLGSAGYDFLPPKEAMARAGAAVSKALEIDDTLAEAHTSKAIIKLQFEWDWVQAEEGFKRAIELKPNYSVAHYWYSILLMAMGRREESIAESKKAQELDLLSMIVNVNVARAYYFARQYDAAVAVAEQVVELDDKFFWAHYILGLSHLQKGTHGEAIAALRKCSELSNDHPTFQGALGYIYASTGDTGKALQILKDFERPSPVKSTPSDVAMVYLGLGNKARALDLLETACDERASSMLGLKVDPVFDGLRSEPRFQVLLSRVGLAAS